MLAAGAATALLAATGADAFFLPPQCPPRQQQQRIAARAKGRGVAMLAGEVFPERTPGVEVRRCVLFPLFVCCWLLVFRGGCCFVVLVWVGRAGGASGVGGTCTYIRSHPCTTTPSPHTDTCDVPKTDPSRLTTPLHHHRELTTAAPHTHRVSDTDGESGAGRYGVKGVVAASEYKKIYQVGDWCDVIPLVDLIDLVGWLVRW